LKVKDLAAALDMRVIQSTGEEDEIITGYTSDLLSDVMAGAKDGSALITVQAHVNAVAVAALAGIPALIICNDRPITADMIEAANREGVAILLTEKDQFTTSHLVYMQLHGSVNG
jgi:serine kinase of HPr protein (carbohydrate metabolism regulator)